MNKFFKSICVGVLALFMGLTPGLAQDESSNKYGVEGVNHLGLAVSKLDESVAFFTDILGWENVGGQPDYPSVFVTNGDLFLTLWQTEEGATAFNRRTNVGLHHLALTVDGLDNLHALHEKLKTLENVKIEFAPEHLGNGPTTHMMIFEPSGNRIEFIVPASRIKP